MYAKACCNGQAEAIRFAPGGYRKLSPAVGFCGLKVGERYSAFPINKARDVPLRWMHSPSQARCCCVRKGPKIIESRRTCNEPVISPPPLFMVPLGICASFVKCYHGVNEGSLFPLKQGLLFMKPALFLPRTDIQEVRCWCRIVLNIIGLIVWGLLLY